MHIVPLKNGIKVFFSHNVCYYSLFSKPDCVLWAEADWEIFLWKVCVIDINWILHMIVYVCMCACMHVSMCICEHMYVHVSA